MHIRGSSAQWQSRRNLGPPVRRAHPASGATWNVQVVRGKITSRCLWHACRALAIGILLMLLGAGMATIGYYANHLSIGQEIRGNATVRVKNESRGFHLNNLSYVGPIVMGVGGFIVVAACVMTFEARDSAAKVVPARFKLSTVRNNNNSKSRSGSRRNTGSQSSQPRWEHHLGVFRTSPACEVVPPPDRQALTAALVHFSRVLGSPRKSPKSHRFVRHLSRSGSVPNLTLEHHRPSHNFVGITGNNSPNKRNHHKNTRNSSISYKSSRGSTADSRLLHPGMLQFHRQALSVDETGPYYKHPNESFHGSKGSMAVEVHGNFPGSAYIINDVITRNRDRSKRSDTAKRHVLSRQKPVEKEEPHSPRSGYHGGRRRSSTTSDISIASRRGNRRGSSVSRTPSVDSRTVQGATSTSIVDINNIHSPEKIMSCPRSPRSPRTPRRNIISQQSTPSVEREFRSQLSVCSDPTAMHTLTCQTSIEPCVPEESPEQEEKDMLVEETIKSDDNNVIKTNRPDTLNLVSVPNSIRGSKKYLYRSNSTKSFKRPSKTKLKLTNEFDQIYFVGHNQTDDDNYNSIEVIDERRKKNFTRLSEDLAKIQRSETVIYNNNNNNNNENLQEQKSTENEIILEKCENNINEIEEDGIDENLVKIEENNKQD